MIKYLLYYIIFIHLVYADYSYYKLGVQKWCTNNYMIHGLWPQISNTAYPSYCTDDIYSDPTGQLKYEMIKLWSSCNNSDLWKHEWLKHGTCIENKYNLKENSYFKITLELFHNNLNLLKKCNNATDCILGCFDLDFNLTNCPK